MNRFAPLLLLCLVGCGPAASSPTTSSPKSQVPATWTTSDSAPATVATLSASELWNAYGENALAAESKYKDKYVVLTGSIRVIKKADDGRFFVGIGVVEATAMSPADFQALPEREKKWFNEGYPPNVVCYLNPAQQSSFASLKPDTGVKLVGKVVGSKKADVWHDYVVELEDCRLAK